MKFPTTVDFALNVGRDVGLPGRKRLWGGNPEYPDTLYNGQRFDFGRLVSPVGGATWRTSGLSGVSLYPFAAGPWFHCEPTPPDDPVGDDRCRRDVLFVAAPVKVQIS